MNWDALQKIRDGLGFQRSDNDGSLHALAVQRWGNILSPLPSKASTGGGKPPAPSGRRIGETTISETHQRILDNLTRSKSAGSEAPIEGGTLRARTRREAFTRPGSDPARRAGSALQVRFQDSPNWSTPRGVAAKRRMIEAQGLPDMKNRRFITLTLDPAQFGYCEVTGYLEGKEKLRRFLEAGRLAGLWERGSWWAWKLEFQKNTWAHWHLIVDRTRKFTQMELATLSRIWGLGRVNCRRISGNSFGYQFKYAFKGVFQDDSEGSGLCLPQWFLEYQGITEVNVNWTDSEGNAQSTTANKPITFNRCRFWQTSKGFYTRKETPAPEKKDPVSSMRPRTAREAMDERNSSALIIARDSSGRYRASVRARLRVDYPAFIKIHLWDSENGAGATLSSRSFFLNPETVKNKIIEKYELCRIQQVLRANKMTVRKALQFRAEFQSLETC